MSLIAWSDDLKVHVNEIDTQHHRLVDLLNQLNDAMRAGHGREVIGKVLDELVTYTKSHFATEERMMATHAYPMTGKHKDEHRHLVEEVGKFVGELQAGRAMVTVEVMNFLRDWLKNHILKTDMELGKFLNGKGVH